MGGLNTPPLYARFVFFFLLTTVTYIAAVHSAWIKPDTQLPSAKVSREKTQWNKQPHTSMQLGIPVKHNNNKKKTLKRYYSPTVGFKTV